MSITTQFEPSDNKQKGMREVWSSRDTFSDTNRASTHSTSSDTADRMSHSPHPDENVDETESLSQTSENVIESLLPWSSSRNEQQRKDINNSNIPHDTNIVNTENSDKGGSEEVDRLEQDKNLSPKNLRGWLATTRDGQKILYLSRTADLSTLMHELMHLYKAARFDARYADKFNKIKLNLRPHLVKFEAAKKRIAEKYGAERFKIAGLPLAEKLHEKRGRE